MDCRAPRRRAAAAARALEPAHAPLAACPQAERILGQALRELGYPREELVVSTKLFFGTGQPQPALFWLSRVRCQRVLCPAVLAGHGWIRGGAACLAGAAHLPPHPSRWCVRGSLLRCLPPSLPPPPLAGTPPFWLTQAAARPLPAACPGST